MTPVKRAHVDGNVDARAAMIFVVLHIASRRVIGEGSGVGIRIRRAVAVHRLFDFDVSVHADAQDDGAALAVAAEYEDRGKDENQSVRQALHRFVFQ